jgi:hypothetical protein
VFNLDNPVPANHLGGQWHFCGSFSASKPRVFSAPFPLHVGQIRIEALALANKGMDRDTCCLSNNAGGDAR